MPTKHEAVAQALMSILTAGLVLVPTREHGLPQVCPAAGLVDVGFEDALEVDTVLGVVMRDIERVASLSIVVQGDSEALRNAAMDAVLIEIGVALHGSTLGGVVEYLHIGEPTEASDIPMEGASALRGVVVPVTLYYQTSDNPMETV